MRHRVDHRKLGRTAAHRKAMLRNMVTSLFLAERITTTEPKAKEARRLAERLITRAKKGYAANQDGNKGVALAHWRQAARHVKKMTVLKKLFEEIAPHYLDRPGGYTRIIKLENRLGDNAREVMLELVDTEVTLKPKRSRKAAEEEAKDGKKKKKEAKAKAKDDSRSKAKGKDKPKWKAKGKSRARSSAAAD